MSADNWTTCPKCEDVRSRIIEKAEARAASSYGSVSVEEFDRLRKEAAELRSSPLKQTFREDYEFVGADGGEVLAIYSGGCATCGIKVKFEHGVRFYPEA